MIIIHYDFTDGTELSYGELIRKDLSKHDASFTTNCLDFFCFDTNTKDVLIVDSAGNTLSRNSLLSEQDLYKVGKKITKSHNIQKMLKAGAFTWQLTLL